MAKRVPPVFRAEWLLKLGLAELANLRTAHTDYDVDERVLALIVHEMGTEATAPIVTQGREWAETR